MKNTKHKFVGYREYRLTQNGNELENIFVKKMNDWIKQNPMLLQQIIIPSKENTVFITEEQEKIAMTVIQWLGTHVGQVFLK